MQKQILVIANTEAGTTFQSTDTIIDILKSHKIPHQLREVETPAEAVVAAKSASKAKTSAVIVFGGDGTVLPVIKASAKKDIPVLPLRGGSANGLARNIGISDNLGANVRSFLNGSYVTHEFPAASANGDLLILDLHFGVFSKSIEDTPRSIKKWFGDKAYHFYTLKNATKDSKEHYEMQLDGTFVSRDAYGCFVLNINVMKVFGVNILPRTKPGFVHVMTVNTRNPLTLLWWYVTKLLTGRPFNRAITSWQGREVIFHQAPKDMTFDDANEQVRFPLVITANTNQVELVVPVLQKRGWDKVWTIVATEWYRRKDHLKRIITGVPSVRFSQINSQLYLGGQYGKKATKAFSERGITGIVSMREYTPKQINEKKNIEILHLPTKDMTPPTLENLREGITFINKHIEDGGSVYVHCRMGEGRGPTMAAAYLIATGMTADQALAHLRHYRPFARPNKKQVAVLRELESEFRP